MYTYVFSCGVVFQSMTKIKDSKRVTAVSQKNLDAASASASVPSYFLLPVLSRTHAYLLPLQWVCFYERDWIFSPLTWFRLCKIIPSKAFLG